MRILKLLLPRPQRLEGETANQREGIQTRAAHAQSCNDLKPVVNNTLGKSLM